MGTTIWKIIPENCVKYMQISSLKGSLLFFDTNNLIFRFVKKMEKILYSKGRNYKYKNKKVVNYYHTWLAGYIAFLYKNELKAVFVIDGAKNELKKRKKERRGNNDTETYEQLIEDTIKFIKFTGFPVLIFASEAEKTAAIVSRKFSKSYVVTNDYDALLFGAKRILRKFSISSDKAEMIELDCLLESLQITYEQLIDIAILSGTDFNKQLLRGVGVKKALKLIRKYKRIEEIPENINENTIDIVNNIRNVFAQDIVAEPKLFFSAPKIESIRTFLLDRKIPEEKVSRIIKRIRKSYEDMMYHENSITQYFE